MRTLEVELLEGYSRDEVILILSRIRRRQIPVSTFYRWLGENGITPKDEYSEDELEILKHTCRHYARNGKSRNLKRPRTQSEI